MGEVFAVTGRAGTGKTTWLMEKAVELAPRILTMEYQELLAITRMHGSRRRLHMKLVEGCKSIPYSVTTIESFALSVLNRWRRSLGYFESITPVDHEADFTSTAFGIEASFSKILTACTKLLDSETVKKIIGESYPLVMIDEFQDCDGPLLDFVMALSNCSTLVIAADEFQLLDSSSDGCSAVEWLRDRETEGLCHWAELKKCHRTSVQDILEAARRLRENSPADSETIPVFACRNYGPAAFKIIEALVYNAGTWRGTTALLCPSHDDFLQEVIDSCANQLKKKNQKPISWFRESSHRQETKELRECLGLENKDACSNYWAAPSKNLTPTASRVIERTQRFARLRGFPEIPPAIVERYVNMAVHERRAYSSFSPKRIVTTIHGAKNREFDNVIIIWPYRVTSNPELNRRLLYNAITRSRDNCMLLVRGDTQRVQNDPVLSLIGPAKEVFLGRKIHNKKPTRQ